MKSIKQQYIDLREGRMTQHNFMRSVRMSLPQYITNVTSFNDTVKILKNKGILNEAIVDKDEDAKVADMIKRMEDEKYGEMTIKSDLLDKSVEKELSEDEDDDDDEEAPEDYVDPNMFNAYGMDASEGLKVVKEPNKYAGKWRIVSVDGKKTPLTNKFFDSEDDAKKYGREKIQTSHKIIQLPAETNVYKKIDEGKKKKEKKELHPNQIHPQELRMGIKVELEHTDNLDKAKKIALDHLAENPFYYTALKLAGVESPSAPKAKAPKAVKKQKIAEPELTDKENAMVPVKGIEKAKASSNKASKETNKVVKGVEELTHTAKTVRGLQKFAATGGKMKTIKLKEEIDPEIEGKPSQAYLDFLAGKKQGEKIMQATNASGVKFSANDMAIAPDGKKIKITGFTTGKDGKMKAMYSAGMFADVYNLDDLKKKPSFRPGVNLGKYDLKSMLEKMVREVIDEMYDDRDDMNAKNEY